jgi:hypothetical protein
MCPICNVTDGGKHHYDCPYDSDNESRVITWKATQEEANTKYVYKPKWRRPDGRGYIILQNK